MATEIEALGAAAQMLQPLTKEEVQNLNKAPTRAEVLLEHGPLEDDRLYLKLFLVNPLQNKAADPMPFKVADRAMERIIESAVGRPFIVGPDPKKHVRGPMGAASSLEDIIQEQQKWAVGQIVRTMINPLSRNAYAIVEVFQEFVDDVKKGVVRGRPLPKYTSPLLAASKMDPHTGEITNGRIIHVQAVDVPGYGPEVAKIVGACDGMLKECTQKLRSLGSSGALRAFQETLAVDPKQLQAEEIQEGVDKGFDRMRKEKPETLKKMRQTFSRDEARVMLKELDEIAKIKAEIEKERNLRKQAEAQYEKMVKEEKVLGATSNYGLSFTPTEEDMAMEEVEPGFLHAVDDLVKYGRQRDVLGATGVDDFIDEVNGIMDELEGNPPPVVSMALPDPDTFESTIMGAAIADLDEEEMDYARAFKSARRQY